MSQSRPDDALRPAIQAMTELVAKATRAPSMLNAQPWRFRAVLGEAGLRGAVIEVRSDAARRLPVADPTGWATRVGCGAAAYGLRVAIAAHGHACDLAVLPEPGDPELIVRVRVGEPRPPTPEERSLYEAIPRRRSNRYPFDDAPAAPAAVDRLLAAAQAEGAWLDVLYDPRRRAAAAALLHEGQDRLMANPAYRAELRSWVRNGDSRDGIPRVAGGPSPVPYDLLAFRDFSEQPRSPGRDFEPHPLVCVLGTASDHENAQVRAGMALHRVLLAGTAAGLASSMLSQAIELPDLRDRLAAELGRSGDSPQMVLRFGYGVRTPATPRRPVSEVLEIAAPDRRSAAQPGRRQP